RLDKGLVGDLPVGARALAAASEALGHGDAGVVEVVGGGAGDDRVDAQPAAEGFGHLGVGQLLGGCADGGQRRPGGGAVDDAISFRVVQRLSDPFFKQVDDARIDGVVDEADHRDAADVVHRGFGWKHHPLALAGAAGSEQYGQQHEREETHTSDRQGITRFPVWLSPSRWGFPGRCPGYFPTRGTASTIGVAGERHGAWRATWGRGAERPARMAAQNFTAVATWRPDLS